MLVLLHHEPSSAADVRTTVSAWAEAVEAKAAMLRANSTPTGNERTSHRSRRHLVQSSAPQPATDLASVPCSCYFDSIFGSHCLIQLPTSEPACTTGWSENTANTQLCLDLAIAHRTSPVAPQVCHLLPMNGNSCPYDQGVGTGCCASTVDSPPACDDSFQMYYFDPSRLPPPPSPPRRPPLPPTPPQPPGAPPVAPTPKPPPSPDPPMTPPPPTPWAPTMLVIAAAFAAASAYTSAWSAAAEDGGAGVRGGAPGPTFGLLKLDVEGMEGELLPWLLSHGLLCRMRYIIIEWHLNRVLNRVPPPRRLAALGLRLSLHSLLEHGCATPPKAVCHDDFTANNFALPVPGLPRVAMEHASWAGRSRGGIDISQATTFYENADFAFFEQVRFHMAPSQPIRLLVDALGPDRVLRTRHA